MNWGSNFSLRAVRDNTEGYWANLFPLVFKSSSPSDHKDCKSIRSDKSNFMHISRANGNVSTLRKTPHLEQFSDLGWSKTLSAEPCTCRTACVRNTSWLCSTSKTGGKIFISVHQSCKTFSLARSFFFFFFESCWIALAETWPLINYLEKETQFTILLISILPIRRNVDFLW